MSNIDQKTLSIRIPSSLYIVGIRKIDNFTESPNFWSPYLRTDSVGCDKFRGENFSDFEPGMCI